MHTVNCALQTLVTLIKIASPSSTYVTRGLKLDGKLKTCGSKESVAWRNELPTHFAKRNDHRSLKATSFVPIEPFIGSIVRDGALSVGKPAAAFGLDMMVGPWGSGGASVFLQNSSFLWGSGVTVLT